MDRDADAQVAILLLTGPPGVGKSAAAEWASDLFSSAGVEHAVVDLDELDRHALSTGPDLHFRNLAAVWSSYAAAGVSRLIVAWTIDTAADLDPFRVAVPGAEIRVCRLRAAAATLVARVTNREPPHMREQLKALALEYAGQMEREEVGDFVVETDDRSLAVVAAEIVRRSGWLDADLRPHG